ncbi:hypothetical protein CC86DRAFT_411485 [Ophiobolus disseminans]|uniref:Kazal-like domain-containing protein n=1 Tax=Ophiobolus disseminans TaxID=1469910 RepID=A0A6A6ZLR8_9PLEO|nr:hypothetical protein CC86DRAFT_411485 [Ophiobolus disseminans]
MKLTTTLILTLGALIVATELDAPEDSTSESISCDTCHENYEFCARNGRTKGQEGCERTCREHVCHRNPECKGCDDQFKKFCVDRHKNACNGPC